MAADAGAALDERQIVDSVLAGDREAFRRLVERESRSVIAVCTRILGDRAEAEDVAQEAFVTAYRSLALVAVRRAVRRLAVADRRAARDPPGGAAQAGDWLDPVADVDPGGAPTGAAGADPADPAGMVIRSERDAQLRAAVAALEEPYREVVALRFFADRSLAEIADVTERPLGTVKTHLHRGLARLRLARRGVGPMTAPRPFGPGELDGAEGATPTTSPPSPASPATSRASRPGRVAGARPGFIDGVMLAVDAEPLAAPAHAAGVALRRGAIGAFLASFSDALRVIARPGFPSLVRAQALALVLVVGAFAAGTGVAAAGAVGLIRDDGGRPSPAPTLEAPTPVVPSPSPSMPSPSIEPPSPDPSAAPTSTATDGAPTPSPPARADRPRRTITAVAAVAAAGCGGGSGSGAGRPGRRRRQRRHSDPEADPDPVVATITAAQAGAVAAMTGAGPAMAARAPTTARAPAPAAGTTGADRGLGRRGRLAP